MFSHSLGKRQRKVRVTKWFFVAFFPVSSPASNSGPVHIYCLCSSVTLFPSGSGESITLSILCTWFNLPVYQNSSYYFCFIYNLCDTCFLFWKMVPLLDIMMLSPVSVGDFINYLRNFMINPLQYICSIRKIGDNSDFCRFSWMSSW